MEFASGCGTASRRSTYALVDIELGPEGPSHESLLLLLTSTLSQLNNITSYGSTLYVDLPEST